jgi:hypothetical protein
MKAITKKEVTAKFAELKTQGATREELADLLKKDPSKPNAKEQKEILDAIFEPASGGGQNGNKNTANEDVMELLADIDYSNLKGEMFKKYVSIVGDRSFIEIKDGQEFPVRGQLLENQEFDFIQVKAKPILQPRYAGVQGTPMDYVGVEVTSDKPLHTTRMAVKQALEMNAQILNQHSRAGHGKYYLLKK